MCNKYLVESLIGENITKRPLQESEPSQNASTGVYVRMHVCARVCMCYQDKSSLPPPWETFSSHLYQYRSSGCAPLRPLISGVWPSQYLQKHPPSEFSIKRQHFLPCHPTSAEPTSVSTAENSFPALWLAKTSSVPVDGREGGGGKRMLVGWSSQTVPCPIQTFNRIQSTLHHKVTHSELQSTELIYSLHLDNRSSLSVESEPGFYPQPLVHSQCLINI